MIINKDICLEFSEELNQVSGDNWNSSVLRFFVFHACNIHVLKNWRLFQ